MILSFAWTTEAYRRGIKTATRRDFAPRTFRAWCNAWDQGRTRHLATDGPVFRGGKGLGYFELMARPYQQRIADMSPEDLRQEATPATTPGEFAKFVGQPLNKVLVVLEFRPLERSAS